MKAPTLRVDQGAAVLAVGLLHYLILALLGVTLLGAALFALMSEQDHRVLRAKLDTVGEIWSAPRGAAQSKLTQVCTSLSE